MSLEEQEELKAYQKAIKVIGGHKAQITQASVILTKVVEAGVVEEGALSKVKSSKAMVEKQMSKIETQMDNLLDNSNLKETTLSDLNGYLLDTGALCEDVNEILGKESKADASALDTSGIGAALSESLMQVQARQPIPSADLPTFNGEPAEFIPFLESFDFIVHENENIPDSMKATYLKRCITEKGPRGQASPAFDLIKHISPTAQNYSIMRQKLEKRFKLGYLNRATYLSNLRKLSTWKPCHSGSEIRKLHDYVTENLDLLEKSGGSSVSESDILLTDILSLIPDFMVNKFLNDTDDKERNLKSLLELIDDSVAKMLEKEVLVPKFKPNINRFSNNNNGANRPNFSSGHFSRSSHTYQSVENNNSRICLFCKKDHSSFTCNTGTVNDRLAIAHNLQICHNCLKPNHYSSDCFHSSNCNCGRSKHCQALCLQNNSNNFNGPNFNSNFSGGRGGYRGPQGGGNGRGNTNSNNRSRGRGGNNSNRFTNNNTPPGNNSNNPPYTNNVSVNSASSFTSIADTECFMEVGRGFVKSKSSDDFIELRFLFDTASNGSYGKTQSLQDVDCKKVWSRDLEVDTFQGGRIKCQSCDIVKLTVFDCNNFYDPTEICVSSVDFVCHEIPTWQLTLQQNKSIRNYQLSDPSQISGKSVSIDILIGLDNYWKFIHHRTDDPGFGPKLRSSKLGWILSGQRDFSNPWLFTRVSRNPLTMHVQTILTNTIESPPDISEDKFENHSLIFVNKSISVSEEEYCSRFSDLETFGIKPDQEISPVLEELNHSIGFNEETNRVKVRLPFLGRIKDKLTNNYALSKTRLDSLFNNKIRKPEHAEFTKKYYAIIADQEKSGVIEKVDTSGDDENSKIHYIPHHAVFKDGSEKLRVVYDGSSASNNEICLNDCLSPGPSLTNELIEMLLRFRTHDVVLSGDIKNAFLEVEVDVADRDYLRFLWYDEFGNLVTYRFARVPFGLRCSSFLLNATIRFHLQRKYGDIDNPDLIQLLSKSIYVDDWLVGTKTPEQALQIKIWLTDFLEGIGMKLHKLNSNSEIVRKGIESDCPEMDSVLGLKWNVSKDEVSINIERALRKMKNNLTKCELYSAPPRIYDPLGLLAPFIFLAKLLFQEVCKAKIKWKDKLPEDIADKFEKWKSQIHLLANISLPRHVLVENYDTVELHGFGDASKVGYCACVYIVSKNGTTKVSNLICSKTRNAPIKEMSIPRLELTASYLLAKLMALVIKFHDHIKFDRLVYYSDSTTVLHWVQSNHKQWTVYVANRVKDINLLSSPDDWKYVRTDQNPADLGSRGLDAADLVGNDFWFCGPPFLLSGQTNTDIPDVYHPTADSLLERKKIVNVSVGRLDKAASLLPCRKNGLPRKLSDISSIDKVFNITSYLIKFISMKLGEARFRKWLGYESHGNFRRLAEEYWIRVIQSEHFGEEVKFCRNQPKTIPSGMKVASSKVKQLRLFLDTHGILRVNTLLQNANIVEDAKDPALLPKHDHFTTCIVWRVHYILKHAGVGQVLAEVRQAYWIPQGRQVIRNILRQCVKCRMAFASPYPVLAQPSLPDFRTERVEVFSSTGVDFAGPLYIKATMQERRKKGENKSIAKREEGYSERMVYLVIFTCAVSRNVHCEVLDGMSVTDFMHGLRRFMSRYGQPSLFYSDNAKTFECVSRELRQVLSSPKLEKFLLDLEITWKFYVAKAPWMGGFIERVVGLFKNTVRRVIGRATIDYQEFLTIIYEINAVLNSRPISYVYDSTGEEEPITPSRLWCGKNVTLMPPLHDIRIDRRDPEICKKRLKFLDKVLTQFWNRFTTQYLTNLSERHLSRNLPRDGRQPKVGEVVLIKNDLLPRGRWKIARIVEVTPGRDGVIRRVLLQPPYKNLTRDKKRNKPSEIISRPPRLLVPLECEVDSTNMDD